MTAEDEDPFGLMNDRGRTRIRPNRAPSADPVGPTRHDRAGAWPEPDPYSLRRADPFRAPGPDDAADRVRHARAHPNPLVASFAPLLELAPELERSAAPQSPETLRVKLLHNLIDARDACVARSVPLSRADQAAWFVAALIDDLAINTPWGGHSDWPRQPLVVSLVGEVDPGTRFFERLAELQRHPNRDSEMLELATVCLALGFRGRARIEGLQAQGFLAQAIGISARLLRDPEAERAPLSPRWEGMDAPDSPRRFAVPLWSIGLVALALVAAIHVGLGMRLSAQASRLFVEARSLPPSERAVIVRAPRAPIGEAPAEKETPVADETPGLVLQPVFEAAAPANTRAALTAREGPSALVLTVRGSDPEVFKSAKADINTDYLSLVASIGRTIVANQEAISAVKVIGHTDSVPVQITNPFGSNQGLSEARAQAIAALLVEAGVPAETISVEGLADSVPVADDDTPDGQTLNRRVEIRVEKRF